jgi:Flp pilus assembly protein TadG
VTGRLRDRDDGGSASLELVVLTPALVGLLGLLVLAGRLAVAGNTVEQAADEAARSASIARTVVGAHAAAQEGARRALAQRDLRVGAPAQVRATLTCTVELSDLALPGFPGERVVTATAVSPLDTYRERG